MVEERLGRRAASALAAVDHDEVGRVLEPAREDAEPPRLAAQETPLELTRLASPITVDGRPDEPAWREVPPLPLTMYAPVFRGTPTQRSEIRVAYDDEAFYAAGWFYDTDPSGIRSGAGISQMLFELKMAGCQNVR